MILLPLALMFTAMFAVLAYLLVSCVRAELRHRRGSRGSDTLSDEPSERGR